MTHILGYTPEEVGEERLHASTVLLAELADEARRFLELLSELQSATGGRKEDLESELYSSVSHLKGHSGVTLECLDELLDALPDEETVAV